MSKSYKLETISYKSHTLTKVHPKMTIAEFLACKKSCEIACSAIYPINGEVYRTRSYPTLVAPVMPVRNAADLPGDFESRLRIYEFTWKKHIDLSEKLVSDKLGIYNMAYAALSEDSIDLLSRDGRYENIHANRDVIGLLSLVDSTHASNASSSNPLHRYKNAMAQYENFTIFPDESISAYTQRLNHVIDCLALNNINIVVTDNDKAWKFFRGLEKNALYKPFVDYIENESASSSLYFGQMTYKAMKDALSMIHLPDVTSSKGNRTAFYASDHFGQHNLGMTTTRTNNDPNNANRSNRNKGNRFAVLDKADAKPDANNKKHLNKGSTDKNRPSAQPSKPFVKKSVNIADVDAPYKSAMMASINSDVDNFLNKAINYWLVYLDSGANVSIFLSSLLSNIRPALNPVSAVGIGGESIELTQIGDLYGFFTVYCSDKVSSNILSYAEVANYCKIEHVKDVGFFVEHSEGTILFEKSNNLFVADFTKWSNQLPHSHVRSANFAHNVKTLESQYTKSEVARARSAYELAINAGYITCDAAIAMINSGDITDVHLSSKDMNRGFEIYGPNSYSIRGRNQDRKPSRAIAVGSDTKIIAEQSMHCDVFHISQQMFLISVTNPLGLCMVADLKDKRADTIGTALVDQIASLKSHGYSVEKVYCDADASLVALKGRLAHIAFDFAGAGDHMPRADERIKCLKKIYRSVLASLNFALPNNLVYPLVIYCCKRLNMLRGNRNEPPAVTIYGFKPSFRREYALAFGDPVEARRPNAISNDATDYRTELCMALYPSSNINGSWIFYNLSTRNLVIRSNWVKLNVNHIFVDKLNCDAVDCGNSVSLEFEHYSKPAIATTSKPDSNSASKSTKPVRAPSIQQHAGSPECTNSVPPVATVPTAVSVPSAAPISEEKVAEDLDESDSVPNPYYKDPNDPDSIPMDYPNLRDDVSLTINSIRAAINAGDKFIVPDKLDLRAYHISIKKGIAQFGDVAVKAVSKEMNQLVDKEVFEYVHNSNGVKIIYSSIFLKEKLDANGQLLLVKARFVANGSMQHEYSYEVSSSPTVKTTSTFIVLKIAVVEHRSIAVIDIGGAYLNADMDKDVYMSIEPKTASILSSVDPTALPFIKKNGTLLVKLKKALYGCKQSGKLWYNCLSSYLLGLGFTMNPKDACVFNIIRNGVQLTLLFHVDDVLMTSVKNDNLIWIQKKITDRFLEIKEQSGACITYLGMQLETLEGGSLQISMNNLLSELIAGRGSRNPPNPANDNLFIINDGSGELDTPARESFHSLVAKLLYLSRMVRPDIAVSVAYLTTRVKNPNQNDLLKLHRVLDYLNATKDLKLIISNVPFKHVDGLIDASFAQHEDGKSHTGFIIELGGTPISYGSTKQHIITVNSTEAELVALSDKYLNVLEVHDFLINQSLPMETPVIYQDNQSTMALVAQTGTPHRNKYFLVRQEAIKYALIAGDFKIEYLQTGEMTADILTKPLQGNLFKTIRSKVLLGDNIPMLFTESDKKVRDEKTETPTPSIKTLVSHIPNLSNETAVIPVKLSLFTNMSYCPSSQSCPHYYDDNCVPVGRIYTVETPNSEYCLGDLSSDL